jgi:hypothetical protein
VLELCPNVPYEDLSESKFLAFPSRKWIYHQIFRISKHDQRLFGGLILGLKVHFKKTPGPEVGPKMPLCPLFVKVFTEMLLFYIAVTLWLNVSS